MEPDSGNGSDVEQLCNAPDRILCAETSEIVDGSSDDAPLDSTDTDECRFCREIDIPYNDIDREDLWSLFHQPCSGCSAQDPSLCARCQHLRLRHHLLCDEDRDYTICIPLNHLIVNLRHGSSPNCAMCSFFVEAARQENESLFPDRDMEKCITFELECRKKLPYDPESIQPAIRGSPWALEFLVWFHDGSPSLYVTLAGFDFQSQKPACIYPPSTGSIRIQDGIFQKRAIPQVGQNINWEVVKNLLDNCCASHQNCHLTELEVELPTDFRLIDVENRCLVHTTHSDVSYFALSYVWGKECGVSSMEQTVATLTKSSLKDLQQRQSLSPSVLPKTVEDALQACLALGSKYLWVCRLCIVQDDDENKNHQIHAMGSIYASAKLVLIAADAENMNSGISGISKLRRHTSQAVMNSSGTVLLRVLPNLEASTAGLLWFSRAWTYQEAVLARRKVWFTRTQVHFECQTGIFTEDLWGSHPANPFTMTSQVHPPGMSTGEAFDWHLSEYSRRSLTYQSDIYNALTGITNSLYGEPGSLVYGLPRRDFDQSLLWETASRNLRDVDGLVLPSWSWASIHARVSLDPPIFCGSLVKWIACVGHGREASALPIRADNEPHSWIEGHSYQNFPYGLRGACSPHLYMAIACIQGCIQTPLPKSLLDSRSQTIEELEMSANTLWPTYKAYCQHLYLCEPQSKELTQANMQKLEPGTLLGRVQTVTLRYTRHIEHTVCRTAEQDFGFEMYDDCNRSIGLWTGVEPHSDFQKGRIKTIALAVYNHGISRGYHPILMCLSSSFPRLACFKSKLEEGFEEAATEVLRDPKEDMTFFDCEGRALLLPPMLKVMVIQEDGPFYRRIGLGDVFLARWLQAGPRFETVLLR